MNIVIFFKKGEIKIRKNSKFVVNNTNGQFNKTLVIYEIALIQN